MICPVCGENIKRIPSHFKNANDKLHADYLKSQCELGKKYLFDGIVISQIRNIDEIVLKRIVECYLYENFKEKIQENAKLNRRKNISKAMSKENSTRKIRAKQLEEIISNGIDGIDYVTCKICGYKNTNISTHVTRFHKITAKEYRKKYGENEKLFCKKTRDKWSKKMKENNPNDNPESIQKMKETINLPGKRERRSKTMKKKYASGEIKPHKNSGRGLGGERPDLGHYVRSMWEANVARILKLKNIEYKYEMEAYPFYNANGELIDSYLPDFYLPKYDTYLEVKGQMDKISLKKIELFRREGKRVIVVDGLIYNKLAKKFKDKIGKRWEYSGRNIKTYPHLFEDE